ncbi:amino-acid N-acetyltransferase [Aestuariicella hydrocarbonica]|uniref:Amino-acid acetyltransferase n=1 Tax=Pseudomaricurvus hydrocarbonicus TaxID=1470433 RepID=A0A9E5JVY6_9GAMM|nr:amino-acid N-acetyltransferase [Aestuariicella hydrocarbonica]
MSSNSHGKHKQAAHASKDPAKGYSKDYVQWFRQSSPYINAHRGKTFVMMLPGAAVQNENFANIIHDIALLNSLGVRLVLVHGARPQIDARLGLEHTHSDFHQQWRVTDAAQIHGVCQAIGEVRFSIEAALSTGLPNSPMHGAHIRVVGGNFVTAKPIGVIDGIDLQHTGKVRRIDDKALHQALDSGAIVLISPLGYSPTGEMFNLGFAEIATQIAIALDADKLIAFTSEEGFYDHDGKLCRQLSVSECGQQLQQLEKDHDHSQSLQACYDACQLGVPRAQMISYRDDGALLQELFTRDGSGTLVHRDNYEFTRQATIDDVGGLLELIEPLEQQGALVRRSRELLESEIDRFTILEKDGTIIACAALYPFGATPTTAELSCVATHSEYRKGGRAKLVLDIIEEQARNMGVRELFVLTTQTAHWFQEQGFVAASLDRLPAEKQSLYNFQRNSKVFIKTL